jgi:hypothetical protein
MRLVPCVVLLLAFGCGGQSRSQREKDGDGRASGGVSGSANDAGVGAAGATGMSGAAGGKGGRPSTDCEPPEFTELCLSTCFAEKGDVTERLCVEGEWICPAGTTLWSDCPPESCAGVNSHCCASNGRTAYRDCDANGNRVTCPAGERAIEYADACVPEGVDVAHCEELDDTPCASADLTCNEGILSCYCQADPETWVCMRPD